MAIWLVDGETQHHDIRDQRIAAGTVGSDHVQARSLGGKKVQAVIDDSDPRIQYGIVTGYGAATNLDTFTATTDFQFGGTYTVIGGSIAPGGAGSGALLRFHGTSIAVLGGVNPSSGSMRVFIDGVETPGRIPVYTGIRISGTTGQAVIGKNDLTVPALAGATSFAPAGTIYLNGELIGYTSRDSSGFYGCTRGAHNTVAAEHNANETIYAWDSVIGLYSENYASKQILYYNPLLEPGDHSIIIVAETNSISGNAEIFFDGFAVDSLLGAESIFTQLATFTVPISTDSNGHADIGSLVANNSDIARLAYLGVTQSDTETSNTVPLCNVGMSYVGNNPFLYVHNGPISTNFTLMLTFAFLGETI